MILSTPCKSIPIPIATLANTTLTVPWQSCKLPIHNYIFAVLRSTSMKHAKETIITQFRCTRRVVLTFPHFSTETGKQISTYHQGSAVNNDSKSVFSAFPSRYRWFREISLQVSSFSLHIHDVRMVWRSLDCYNLWHFKVDTLSSWIPRVSVAVQSISKEQLLESLLSDWRLDGSPS